MRLGLNEGLVQERIISFLLFYNWEEYFGGLANYSLTDFIYLNML